MDELFNTPMSLGQYLLNIERKLIYTALERNKWNEAAAARELKINSRTMRYRLQRMREWSDKTWPQVGRPVKRHATYSKVRMLALIRDGGKCQACGKTAADGVKIQVDHIKPRDLYPELACDIDNLQVLCSQCNTGKGKQIVDFRPQ